MQSSPGSVLSSEQLIDAMQVTEEDGGRLNAFAKEPRMEVMGVGESSATNSKLLLIGGAVLVLLMVGVAVGIS
jgi:hypothetical protein